MIAVLLRFLCLAFLTCTTSACYSREEWATVFHGAADQMQSTSSTICTTTRYGSGARTTYRTHCY